MKKAPKKVFICWDDEGNVDALYFSLEEIKADHEDPKAFVAYTIVVKEDK